MQPINNYTFNYQSDFLEKWKESDIDDKLDFEINGIQSLPKDSNFSDTDLVILEDSFHGLMPLNGIKNKDFNEIESLYNSIKAGRSKIQCNDDSIIECIRILLTREIGRKLIKTLHVSPIETKIIEGKQSEYDYIGANRWITLKLNPSISIGIDALGNRHSIQKPCEISLGHEIGHALRHPCDDKYKKFTIDAEYGNLEEQIVITGLPKSLKIEPTLDLDNNDFTPKRLEGYHELNERNLTSSYTHLKLFPRVGHSGLGSKGIDQIEFTKKCIEYNVWADLSKLFKEYAHAPEKILDSNIIDLLGENFENSAFFINYLQWANEYAVDTIRLDQFLTIEGDSVQDELTLYLSEFEKTSTSERGLLFQKFTHFLFNNSKTTGEGAIRLIEDETYHRLFDSLLCDPRLIIKYLAKGHGYSAALIQYIYENPYKYIDLTKIQKQEADEIFRLLFSNKNVGLKITKNQFKFALIQNCIKNDMPEEALRIYKEDKSNLQSVDRGLVRLLGKRVEAGKFFVEYLQWINRDDADGLQLDQLIYINRYAESKIDTFLYRFKNAQNHHYPRIFEQFTKEVLASANKEFEFVERFKSLKIPRDATYHFLFDDVLNNTHLISKYLAKGGSFAGALISYIYDNSAKHKNLSTAHKTLAKTIYSGLFDIRDSTHSAIFELTLPRFEQKVLN